MQIAGTQSQRFVKQITLVTIYVGILFGFYLIPSWAELQVFNYTHQWLWFPFVGDLVGCGIIASMGRCRLAIGIYLIMTGLEIVLPYFGLLSIKDTFWVMNLMPAIAVAWLVRFCIPRLPG